MNHASLFSGIGGFDLAAEWMGWTNLFHVERDEFCRDILRHHFPNTQSYEDIKQFNGYPWAGHVDVLTGGFPCQPFSTAGQRQGVSDDRYLWPEMLRVIREARPTWVVAENVRGLTSWSGGMVFDQVITDLEGEGYQVLPTVLPAASVANCPHKRDRVWIIAYAHGSRNDRAPGQDVGTKPKGRVQEWHEVVFSVESNGLRGLPASADDLGWNRWWSEQRVQGVATSRMVDLASAGILPTPTARCWNQGTEKERPKGQPTRRSELNHLVSQEIGKPSHLSPRFVAEMMGFPPNWTELPFQSGEKKV
jgi:DNA-cytosine methyltransferase